MVSEVPKRLSSEDHSRDAAGMRYVYPVVSRRAKGVSIGINLNANNACNWACIYCQVPGLSRGGPPEIDLALLETELAAILDDVLAGSFLAERVGENMRRLADVAFSGNGEPTASRQFATAVEIVVTAMQRRGLLGKVPLRLITNGSLVERPDVQEGIRRIDEASGEVWFKVDRGSASGLRAVNRTATTPERVRRRLLLCASLAPTWIQSCWFGGGGESDSGVEEVDFQSFLDFLAAVKTEIRGVHLYGVARPSMQPGGSELRRLSPETLAALAGRIKKLGVTVISNP